MTIQDYPNKKGGVRSQESGGNREKESVVVHSNGRGSVGGVGA
ncbi:MAG: hypothetical protein AB4080_06660 [Trichodesmium sp.]